MSGTLTIGNETLFTHSDSTGMSYGSGIPAGSVIQTVYRKYDSLVSAAITSNTPTIATSSGGAQEYYGTISNLTSGNHVLVQMSFPAYIFRASKLVGCSFHIFRDSSSSIVYGDVSSGNKRTLFQYTEGSVSEVVIASLITLSYIDTNPTASSHTYYMGASTDSSGTINFYTSSSNEFTCILMEIAQ